MTIQIGYKHLKDSHGRLFKCLCCLLSWISSYFLAIFCCSLIRLYVRLFKATIVDSIKYHFQSLKLWFLHLVSELVKRHKLMWENDSKERCQILRSLCSRPYHDHGEFFQKSRIVEPGGRRDSGTDNGSRNTIKWSTEKGCGRSQSIRFEGQELLIPGDWQRYSGNNSWQEDLKGDLGVHEKEIPKFHIGKEGAATGTEKGI